MIYRLFEERALVFQLELGRLPNYTPAFGERYHAVLARGVLGQTAGNKTMLPRNVFPEAHTLLALGNALFPDAIGLDIRLAPQTLVPSGGKRPVRGLPKKTQTEYACVRNERNCKVGAPKGSEVTLSSNLGEPPNGESYVLNAFNWDRLLPRSSFLLIGGALVSNAVPVWSRL